MKKKNPRRLIEYNKQVSHGAKMDVFSDRK